MTSLGSVYEPLIVLLHRAGCEIGQGIKANAENETCNTRAEGMLILLSQADTQDALSHEFKKRLVSR